MGLSVRCALTRRRSSPDSGPHGPGRSQRRNPCPRAPPARHRSTACGKPSGNPNGYQCLPVPWWHRQRPPPAQTGRASPAHAAALEHTHTHIADTTANKVLHQCEELGLHATAREAARVNGRQASFSDLKLPLGLGGLKALDLRHNNARVAHANASARGVGSRLHPPKHGNHPTSRAHFSPTTRTSASATNSTRWPLEQACAQRSSSSACADSPWRASPGAAATGVVPPPLEPTPEATWVTPPATLHAPRHWNTHNKLSRKLFANPHGHTQNVRCFLKSCQTLRPSQRKGCHHWLCRLHQRYHHCPYRGGLSWPPNP